MTASFHYCWTFTSARRGCLVGVAPFRRFGLVAVRVSTVPREGRPVCCLHRCGNLLFRVAGAYLGCQDQACRISRAAASGRITPISCECALCPRWSPMRNCFFSSTWRSKKGTTVALRTILSQLHACLRALRNCASLLSIFRRCQAACIASVAACSSASVWAFPLQPRPGLLRSWGGITNSTVRIMAAADAASTPPILLSPGGFALRCLPAAVTIWRLRLTSGLEGDPHSVVLSKVAGELDGSGHNVEIRNGKERGLGAHRNVPYELAITSC